MKCLGTLIRGVVCSLVLMLATTSVADTPAFPVPCRTPAAKLADTNFEIPTPLQKPAPLIPQGCDRPFLFHGEFYSADSPEAQDATNLKYFVREVPEAVAYLDEYQSNREKSKLSAYTGTFGLLMIFLLSHHVPRWVHPSNQNPIAAAIRAAGVALTFGGFFYSFTLLQTNENLIPKAVDAYNHSKPEEPIELRFSAGWSF